MAPSKLQSFTLPIIGTAGIAPVPLAVAGSVPTRVVVRNFSAVAAYLAFDSNDLKDASSSATFRIPSRSSDVLLLSPGQSLFAMGEAASSQLSVAISEAFPISIRG